jgi:hypothetical protein
MPNWLKRLLRYQPQEPETELYLIEDPDHPGRPLQIFVPKSLPKLVRLGEDGKPWRPGK